MFLDIELTYFLHFIYWNNFKEGLGLESNYAIFMRCYYANCWTHLFHNLWLVPLSIGKYAKTNVKVHVIIHHSMNRHVYSPLVIKPFGKQHKFFSFPIFAYILNGFEFDANIVVSNFLNSVFPVLGYKPKLSILKP